MSKNPLGVVQPLSLLNRILDSDIFYSFSRSPVTVLSAIVTAVFFIAAAFAPWVAPHNPFDPATLELMDAFTPPAWEADGSTKFLLGTDDQGRDVFSTIIFGSRVSLIVGFSAVMFSAVLGVGLGLLAGYIGGWLETMVMRMADVQLTIPAILVALMIDGVARILVPVHLRDVMAIYVLILAIGISDWPRYARVTRGAALVERNKEYVSAARVIGVHPIKIMLGHVLPNVMGPVLVLATIGLALAIITEATLSFLGVGLPQTEPSLGLLISNGFEYMLSGRYWISFFPGIALLLTIVCINLVGDQLRDVLNPRLQR